MTKSEKRDAYQMVTDSVLAKLDEGVAPWHKPWNADTGMPMSLSTGKPYRGINVLLLGMQMRSSRWWVTFKQAKARAVAQAIADGRTIETTTDNRGREQHFEVKPDGTREFFTGGVRKGEKGTHVVLWKPVEKRDKVTQDVTDKFLLLRYYTVFSLDQCDGIADPDANADETREPVAAIDACENLWNEWKMRPEVKHGGGRAFYSPVLDYIGMPQRDDFESSEGYYATLFHEGIHATGHESRLKRDMTGSFGSGTYGHEELTAEFGAAMLCAVAGIEPNVEQHAAYIASWRKAISSDPRMLVQAAARAQKAADYILGAVSERDADSPEKPAEQAAAAA